MTEQLSLFRTQQPTAAAPTTLVWSHSRRDTFTQCLRRYYYQYFGASKRFAKEEPLKNELRLLKGLSNRHLRSGDLLHLVLGTYLKKGQADGWTLERALSWAKALFHKDFAFSRGYQRGQALPGGKGAPVLLREFYLGDEDAVEVWQASNEQLETAIRHFFLHPDFALFHDAIGKSETVVEMDLRHKENGHTIHGKLDLCFREGDELHIADWKIGKPGSADESLQLLSYAFLASKTFDVAPEAVKLHRAHLSDGVDMRFEVSTEGTLRARARIMQDLESMQSLDTFGQQGVSGAFTPCGQPAICAGCAFQETCPKE